MHSAVHLGEATSKHIPECTHRGCKGRGCAAYELYLVNTCLVPCLQQGVKGEALPVSAEPQLVSTAGCKLGKMKIVLAAVLAGAVVATTNAQALSEPREQRELRGLQAATSGNTCTRYIAVGGTCSDTSSCVASAFCSDATKTCVRRPGNGAKCGNDIFCAARSGCYVDTTTTFTAVGCRALPVDGQDCLFGEFGQHLCDSGLRCYSEGPRNVCRNPTTVTTKACSVDKLCPDGQGCLLNTQESCVPSRKPGESCGGNTPGICTSGYYCRSNPMTCTKLGGDGADCSLDSSASCASGLSCVYEKSWWFFTVFRCRTTPTTEGANCVDKCGSIPATTTSPAVPLNCRR
jgi:hypothetical protein